MWRPQRWARDTDADGERPLSTNLWQSVPSEVASLGLASSSSPGVDFADLLAATVPWLKQGDATTPRRGAAIVEVGRLRRTAIGLNQSVKRRHTEGEVRS